MTVAVEAYDLGRTLIRVDADGPLGSSDGETARKVMNRILDRLEE